jgi:hypothetical protein
MKRTKSCRNLIEAVLRVYDGSLTELSLDSNKDKSSNKHNDYRERKSSVFSNASQRLKYFNNLFNSSMALKHSSLNRDSNSFILKNNQIDPCVDYINNQVIEFKILK